MRQTSIVFKSTGVNLEGIISFPEGLPPPFPGVVVCHPHPLFGGSMDNGVVIAVCRSLTDEGFCAMRFNFRGVGGSEGTFSKGEKEQDDVRAALDLMKRWPGLDRRRLGLVGYSFGASMILAGLARYSAAKAIALISPPLGSLEGKSVKTNETPKIFVVGDEDKLVPYATLMEKVDSLEGSVELRTVVGADHAWRGREGEAATETAAFFVRNLQR